jgi:hypothetical protein
VQVGHQHHGLVVGKLTDVHRATLTVGPPNRLHDVGTAVNHRRSL